ncbi:MAG: arginine N-succinyltransferase, partial [Acinetobacter sp.]|uniref:arginine N-succinyltransferase n=2 Tax=Acinetobacter sp. TaxID=472 RepID=UPI002FCCA791
SDENGRSPFWDALGHHFFDMDFATADYLSGIGQKVFIAELMPRFPVYMDLLPSAAQQVIAQVHPQTLPAAHVLETEGLRYQGYVDIFDAGPTLEAEIKDLRAVQDSRVCKVRLVPEVQEGTIRYLVANDCYQHYRAILVSNQADHASLPLTAAQAEALGVEAGQCVRLLPLDIMEKQ